MLSRRLPEGSAGRKTCARFETLASRDAASTAASVQGAHGGGGLLIAVQPPPLLEMAPFGLSVQPPRELAASQSKENQGKMLGFPWIPLAESGLFNGLRRKNKKILRPLNSLVRLHANAGPGRIPTASRTQRSVDRQLVSAERHNLFFWICQRIGLRPRGRRSIRMSREACAGRSPFDPGGDEVRGSSSVVVRRATILPLATICMQARREKNQAPRFRYGRGSTLGET
jgi:hypothetical protein